MTMVMCLPAYSDETQAGFAPVFLDTLVLECIAYVPMTDLAKQTPHHVLKLDGAIYPTIDWQKSNSVPAVACEIQAKLFKESDYKT